MNVEDHSVRPGRQWYVVPFIILLIGGYLGVVFIRSGLSAIETGIHRFVVPGTADVTLNTPGAVTIFHEPRALIDGTYSVVENLAGLRLSLVPAAGGNAVPLTVPGANASYNMGGHSGTAIAVGSVPAAGQYRLTVGYDDGRPEPRTVLAVAQDFAGGLLRTVLGGIGIIGATVIGAVGVFLLVFFKRRRVLRPARIAVPTTPT